MKKKIIITNNGPYKVIGGVPLNELIIKEEETGNVFVEGRSFDVKDEYYLCRCGKSSNAPFCDGTHLSVDFDGELSAPTDYMKTDITNYPGIDIVLHDNEKLCAFARFCHNNETSVWGATAKNDRVNAEKLSKSCPSGRLILEDKETGEKFRNDYPAEISIIQDPGKKCSGPLWIKGDIQIEDEAGNIYETGNSVTLCRCGGSDSKPFCDASHVSMPFHDKK